jgi:hypothetical protein
MIWMQPENNLVAAQFTTWLVQKFAFPLILWAVQLVKCGMNNINSGSNYSILCNGVQLENLSNHKQITFQNKVE